MGAFCSVLGTREDLIHETFLLFFCCVPFPREGWGALRVVEESFAWRFGVWGLGP